MVAEMDDAGGAAGRVDAVQVGLVADRLTGEDVAIEFELGDLGEDHLLPEPIHGADEDARGRAILHEEASRGRGSRPSDSSKWSWSSRPARRS